MSDYNIAGIQQVGVGVANLEEAWRWYAKHFGMDLPIFNDAAEATLMSEYTGGEPQKRKAVLAMNLQGGGGFEVWQFTSRTPTASKNSIKEGDLGINSVQMRCLDAHKTKAYFDKLPNISCSAIKRNDLNKSYFEVVDPFSNSFKIIEDNYQFMRTNSLVGGVIGATIGVRNIEKSLTLYTEVLNYEVVQKKQLGEDGLERIWLTPKERKTSAFSQLLGPTQLELVCDPKNDRTQIFKGRYWGDLGFIHICFDVQNMNSLRKKAKALGHEFVVDSENSFDMGEAAGQFAYVQDEDNTLIELVETHKVPILKKLSWYIHLKDKKNQKPLPRIIFKVLGMKRLKV